MILEYLLPLIAAVIASIGLFLSRPERRRVAFVTAALTLCLGAWQSYGQFLSDRTSDVIERRAVQELSGATATFLNMLSEAVFRSSDGWLPTTEEEFFSARTAELICARLNGQARAPAYPDQPWWSFASESARNFREVLDRVFSVYGERLGAELLTSVSATANSHLVDTLQRQLPLMEQGRRAGIPYAPVLCWGLEPLAAESLQQLHELETHLSERERVLGFKSNRDWLRFPLPHHKHLLGADRFPPQQLESWQSTHPGAPGPTKFGPYDPNKGAPPSDESRETP